MRYIHARYLLIYLLITIIMIIYFQHCLQPYIYIYISVEDDVDVWRYAIVSCMPEMTNDDCLQPYYHLNDKDKIR